MGFSALPAHIHSPGQRRIPQLLPGTLTSQHANVSGETLCSETRLADEDCCPRPLRRVSRTRICDDRIAGPAALMGRWSEGPRKMQQGKNTRTITTQTINDDGSHIRFSEDVDIAQVRTLQSSGLTGRPPSVTRRKALGHLAARWSSPEPCVSAVRRGRKLATHRCVQAPWPLTSADVWS
jgi:hypothetical protein